MADRRDRPAARRRARRSDAAAVAPGASASSTRAVAPVARRDLGARLAGAEERARQDEPRWCRQSGEPRPESPCLLDSLGGQLAQLVRLPGRRLGMPAEVDAHADRIGGTRARLRCNAAPSAETTIRDGSRNAQLRSSCGADANQKVNNCAATTSGTMKR